MVAAPPKSDPQLTTAGLRTSLVSRLTGLTEDRLRYWHKSGLIGASLRSGSRGVPRLYNWVDYLRLRVAAGLDKEEVPPRRIRRAVDNLDRLLPEWYLLPDRTRPFRARVITQAKSGHWFLASEDGSQFILSLEDLEADPELGPVLEDLQSEGSALGELREYADAVEMRPGLNLARPTMTETSLETSFVAGMVSDIGEPSVINLYKLQRRDVRRVIEFEEHLHRAVPA